MAHNRSESPPHPSIYASAPTLYTKLSLSSKAPPSDIAAAITAMSSSPNYLHHMDIPLMRHTLLDAFRRSDYDNRNLVLQWEDTAHAWMPTEQQRALDAQQRAFSAAAALNVGFQLPPMPSPQDHLKMWKQVQEQQAGVDGETRQAKNRRKKVARAKRVKEKKDAKKMNASERDELVETSPMNKKRSASEADEDSGALSTSKRARLSVDAALLTPSPTSHTPTKSPDFQAKKAAPIRESSSYEPPETIAPNSAPSSVTHHPRVNSSRSVGLPGLTSTKLTHLPPNHDGAADILPHPESTHRLTTSPTPSASSVSPPATRSFTIKGTARKENIKQLEMHKVHEWRDKVESDLPRSARGKEQSSSVASRRVKGDRSVERD